MNDHTIEPQISTGDLIERVVAMEADVGGGHWDEAARWFTDDVAYHVAGRPAFRGIDGIRRYMTWQRAIVAWHGHESRLVLQTGQTVVIEADSLFERVATGVRFSLPCTDVYRFRDTPDGPRLFDWRVYADVSHFLDRAFPFEAE